MTLLRCDRCRTSTVTVHAEQPKNARQLAEFDHRWRHHIPHRDGMWADLCPGCIRELLDDAATTRGE